MISKAFYGRLKVLHIHKPQTIAHMWNSWIENWDRAIGQKPMLR